MILRYISPNGSSGNGGEFGAFDFGDLPIDYVNSDTLYPAVNGAQHSCPIIGHGTTTITAITIKSYINGKLILTAGATAGCGAKMTPPDRKVYVE